MSTTTIRAKTVAPRGGPFIEMPQRAKLQEMRSGVGLVIPRELLRYYGIVNTDSVSVEISPAEGGYYLRLIHQEGAFG